MLGGAINSHLEADIFAVHFLVAFFIVILPFLWSSRSNSLG
jgi:hypothetical protein